MAGHTSNNQRHHYYHCRGRLRLSEFREQCPAKRPHPAGEINDGVREMIKLAFDDDEILRNTLKLPEREPVDYEKDRQQLKDELKNAIRLTVKGILSDDELAEERARIERALELIPDPPSPSPKPGAKDLAAWRRRVKEQVDGDLHALVEAADVLVTVHPDRNVDIVLR